jgi:hypothetical protein
MDTRARETRAIEDPTRSQRVRAKSMNQQRNDSRIGEAPAASVAGVHDVGQNEGVTTSRNVPSRSQWERLLSNRRSILLLLFCVTGFLGLPLLWMSHAFSTTEKVVWSVVNSIFTLVLIGLCMGVCYWCYLQLHDAGIL